jgi:hypothetical protein
MEITMAPRTPESPKSQLAKARPLTIGRLNVEAFTGMSWDTALRFAREHGVEVLKVSPRLQLIPAGALYIALRDAAAKAPPLTFADELAAMERAFGAEVRKPH